MNKHMLHIGEFLIRRDLIENQPDRARDMLAGMIVVRAELQWVSNAILYTAIHPDFDQIEPGELPPFYHAESEVDAVTNAPFFTTKFKKWCRA